MKEWIVSAEILLFERIKGKITTVAFSSTVTKKGSLYKITAEFNFSKEKAQLVRYDGQDCNSCCWKNLF